MINQKLLKVQKEQIFGENLPIRKSMIINENVLFWDLDNSTSTIRPNNRRNTQLFQTKKSLTALSGIIYPASTFLAQKLKRILHSHLLQIFKEIKRSRKKIINLNLLSQKYKRLLYAAFFEIRLYHQFHKGSQLESVIAKNRRPYFIYHSVGKVVRKRQRQAMSRLLKLKKRRQNMEIFAKILQKLLISQIKSDSKKTFMRNLKKNSQIHTKKSEGAEGIVRFIPKIMKRIKLQAFRNIISVLKAQEFQVTNLMKKEITYKMNEASTQRARALTNQRQKIKNIKNDLDFYSSDRSKARYEVRKDINVQRGKLKEEEKKFRSQLLSLNEDIEALQIELAQIFRLNEKRVQKKNLRGDQMRAKNLFNELQKMEENKVGEICPSWPKQRWEEFGEGQNLDEFHVYKNQKLRQLILEYENVGKKKGSESEEMLVEQNVSLKEMLQCIIRRSVENVGSKQRLKQIQY